MRPKLKELKYDPEIHEKLNYLKKYDIHGIPKIPEKPGKPEKSEEKLSETSETEDKDSPKKVKFNTRQPFCFIYFLKRKDILNSNRILGNTTKQLDLLIAKLEK